MKINGRCALCGNYCRFFNSGFRLPAVCLEANEGNRFLLGNPWAIFYCIYIKDTSALVRFVSAGAIGYAYPADIDIALISRPSLAGSMMRKAVVGSGFKALQQATKPEQQRKYAASFTPL